MGNSTTTQEGDEGSEAMKGRGEGEASEETNLVLVSQIICPTRTRDIQSCTNNLLVLGARVEDSSRQRMSVSSTRSYVDRADLAPDEYPARI